MKPLRNRRSSRMTLEAFERFVSVKRIALMVRPPYDVRPCACGDVNCHGWRFVASGDDASQMSESSENSV